MFRWRGTGMTHSTGRVAPASNPGVQAEPEAATTTLGTVLHSAPGRLSKADSTRRLRSPCTRRLSSWRRWRMPATCTCARDRNGQQHVVRHWVGRGEGPARERHGRGGHSGLPLSKMQSNTAQRPACARMAGTQVAEAGENFCCSLSACSPPSPPPCAAPTRRRLCSAPPGP